MVLRSGGPNHFKSVCSCVLTPKLDRPNSLALPRILPLGEKAGAFRHPAVSTPKSPRHLAPSVGTCKCWLDLQASEAELILCNGDEKMKRGMAAPTPHVTAPRQQRPRCGGARQRRLLCVATATPQSRRSGAQRRRPLCATLQHLRVGSRFSLKQPPGLPCGDMASAQGFLSI